MKLSLSVCPVLFFFHFKMDSTDIFQIFKLFSSLTDNGITEMDNGFQVQSSKLDAVYNELLQSAQNVPEKKNVSKRQSKTKNDHVGDLFAAEPGFQQPAVPPIRRTTRQASIIATDKIKSIRESSTISSSGPSTRASRARALSTFMDIAPIACPTANSTFVVDKKNMRNVEEPVSPGMFSPDIGTHIKETNANKTYDLTKRLSARNQTKKLGIIIDLPEESPISAENTNSTQPETLIKLTSKNKSLESQIKNKRREKLEDIDVNIAEKSHMTRTMKRKLQEENNIDAKKTNVLYVPLEKQISTPGKSLEDLQSQTPHQIRENEAEKRKELHLKSKADQRKFEDQHLRAAKHREEQMKRAEEKLKKTAEEKRKKEEKQKEKETMMKEEALKKQKLAELRLAEINAKRKLAEEAKHLKIQKLEMNRAMKENELKKKIETKPEKSKSVIRPKALTSNIPTSSASKPASKIDNKNDYGLNDVSARDSSEDESGPKKPVPNWAKRENRKAVLELQYHIDSKERDLFFDCPKSMSLKEMFKGWNIRDKQRTSSAVWNTPPRYSEYIRRY
ncbi:inner centromere protein isoform X1 [Acyrthosiphon pisum]|uniref:Inner centromere protein ARK-binding domain-containing protein n=2 Tax=Acyrthosiphon pisum TaxID=7029 RepID=A0A8R2JPU3_ACYPI|nr:inner centromere protein isoform X1 [Acyrthosiphon pisum]XP_029343528.1 inner centromere protein isoform X1 [Acyrthosiphon pisum]